MGVGAAKVSREEAKSNIVKNYEASRAQLVIFSSLSISPIMRGRNFGGEIALVATS